MKKEEINQLKKFTHQLLNLNHQALNQYEKLSADEQYTPNYYQEIKPFADKIFHIASQWKDLALKWLQQEKINSVYPHQIENTYENLLIVSVKAFQKETRTKRFMEMIQSIDFVLQTIDRHL